MAYVKFDIFDNIPLITLIIFYVIVLKMYLSDIEIIRVALKESKASKIKLLDKLIFKNENTRLNRNRVMNFEGFNFKIGDNEFLERIKETVEKFKLNELVKICDVLSIASEGTQLEIAKNIITCLCDFEILKNSITTENILEEETDELRKCDQSVQYENESCDDNVFKIDSSVKSLNNKYEQNIIVSFNDIESIITPFKGERYENVLNWIENFEAQAELLSLSEVHKFIYAKRCLRGNALVVVRSESNINSWQQLKDLLMEEFKTSFNSAEVHEMLQKRKMKSNESPLEYFYSMKEISQQSSIDEQALISYIIKGINDSTQNKTMLFGCTSIVEFKTKLRVYETYKREMKQSESFNRVPNASNEIGKRPQIHCYNCQQLGHKAYECKAKTKHPKPKNFNYTKVLKAPTTHTVQDLPPNPCKFCAQLGIMNAFHWGYSCINKPYRTETTPQPQPKQ